MILCYYKKISKIIEHNSVIFKDSFWSLSGAMISRFMMLLTNIIIANLIGKVTYGEYSILQSTMITFSMMMSYGMAKTATKYIAEYRKKDRELTSQIVSMTLKVSYIIGLLTFIIFLLFSPFISSTIISAPHLTLLFMVSSLSLYFSIINSIQIGILSGFQEFKKIAKGNIASIVISSPISIIFCYFYGLLGLSISLVIFQLLSWLIFRKYLNDTNKYHEISFHSVKWKNNLSLLWKFSLPITASGLAITLSIWIANTLLVNYDNGFAEMGLFNAAFQWATGLQMIGNFISYPYLPFLSSVNLGHKDGHKILIHNIILIYSLTIAITLIPGLIMIYYSKYLMGMYGASFIEGNNVLVILIISTIVSIITAVGGIVLTSLGRIKTLLLINIIWGISFILFSTYCFEHNALGLAKAKTLSQIIQVVIIKILFIYYYVKLLSKNKNKIVS